MSLADLQQDAVRHEGEVQRAHRILGLDRLAVELAGQPLRRGRQHLAHGFELDAAAEAIRLRERRVVAAIDEHDAVGIERRKRPKRRVDRLARDRCSRAKCGRQSFAQPLTQIGILPFLDAPMRQTTRLEDADGLLAQVLHPARSGQMGCHRLELLAERCLGFGFHNRYIHLDAPAALLRRRPSFCLAAIIRSQAAFALKAA